MSFRRETGKPVPLETAEQQRPEDEAFERRMLLERICAEVDSLPKREVERNGPLAIAGAAFAVVMGISLGVAVFFGHAQMRTLWSLLGSMIAMAPLIQRKRAPTRTNLLLGIAVGSGLAVAMLVAGRRL